MKTNEHMFARKALFKHQSSYKETSLSCRLHTIKFDIHNINTISSYFTVNEQQVIRILLKCFSEYSAIYRCYFEDIVMKTLIYICHQ